MVGSFLAEVLKLRKRTMVWVLGVLWLAVVVLFLYLLPALIFASAPPELQAGLDARSNPLTLENLAVYLPSSSLFPYLGTAMAIVLGASVAGSEYGWDTLKSVLSQRPSRLVVLSGKLLALAGLLLIFVLAAFLVGAVSSLVVALLEGLSLAPPSASGLLGGLAAGALILVVWAAFGFVLGTLLRSTASAVALGLIYAFFVEPAFSSLSALSGPLRAISRFLPGVNTSSVPAMGAGGAAGNQLSQQNLPSPALSALVLVLYAAVFVFVAALVFRQRDVT